MRRGGPGVPSAMPREVVQIGAIGVDHVDFAVAVALRAEDDSRGLARVLGPGRCPPAPERRPEPAARRRWCGNGSTSRYPSEVLVRVATPRHLMGYRTQVEICPLESSVHRRAGASPTARGSGGSLGRLTASTLRFSARTVGRYPNPNVARFGPLAFDVGCRPFAHAFDGQQTATEPRDCVVAAV